MRLYNSLSRKKETFQPRPEERVNLFVCGPTVYDYSHIGHARTYLAYDALVKFMRQKNNWDVFYLQNITDIDDKIIKRAEEENKDVKDIALKFEDEYKKDMEALGIDSVSQYARATDHIPEIISQIERLIKTNNVYKAEDGYYFDISSFSGYGKLSGRTKEAAEDAVSRIDDGKGKKNKGDFAVWKFSQKNEPGWESPFGFGRPGWHIEDTAITEKNFGVKYHLHGGAEELKFPHHEAEIAQMESISGLEPMVQIWIHTGVLTVDGKKMSKSKGNFITIDKFLEKNTSKNLRMLVFSSHYRSPINYSDEMIKEAELKLEKLNNFARKLKEIKEDSSPFPFEEFITKFWQDLGDDFNTPKALAGLFQLITETNKLIDNHTLSQNDAQKVLGFIDEINAIFNIIPKESGLPKEILKLAEERDIARENKDFKKSDEIREEIKKRGYIVEDTPGETRIHKAQ